MSAASPQKAVVERYVAGFRAGDHAAVLACLTEDVVWELPGFKHIEGRAGFGAAMQEPGFDGPPELHVERLVEEGAVVVAIGWGSAARVDGSALRFTFADVLTFRDGLVERVESYVVPLGPGA